MDAIYIYSQPIHIIWDKWYWHNSCLEQYNTSNKVLINPARSRPYPNPRYIFHSICDYEFKYRCDILRFKNVNWRQSIPGMHQLTNLFHAGSFIGDGPAPRRDQQAFAESTALVLVCRYTRLRPRTPTTERAALVARKQIAGRLLSDIVLNNLANRRSCCERNSHYPPDQEARCSSSVWVNQQSCELLSAIRHP